MGAASPLSEQDLAEVRAEVSAGKQVTVWFTSAAVGVPVNGSAKVISIGDHAEGDFIQVRPAGTRDTMFCSPSELTRTRPARKRAQPPAPPAPEPIVPPETVTAPSAKLPEKTPEMMSEKTPENIEMTPEKTPARPRSSGGRSAAKAAEVTVTLSATNDGEWTVEVMIGKKRTVRPTPVQPGEVAKAARSLPETVAEAIEASLEAARQRQLERVERLRAELDAAQQALQDLSS